MVISVLNNWRKEVVMHKEYIGNWNELIKRRAISDLFKIIRDCNNEIVEVMDKYYSILRKVFNKQDLYLQYTPEQFMHIESALYQCRQYFSSDKDKSFEEYLAMAIVSETEIVETEFIADIANQTSHFEYDEGTTLALKLIDDYAEALKMKILESASNNMLDLSRENSGE